MPAEVVTILGTCLIMFLGIVLFAYAREFNRRQNRHYKEKELMNAQFQQVLLSSQLEIQEHTFKTISQELHDNIGQMLTLVKLNLNSIDFESVPQSKEKVNEAKTFLGKVIQDLRDISKTLNSDAIGDVGIAKAIETELRVISKVANIQTSFDCNQAPENIDPQVELILFRVIQEALHNIIKHAKATTVKVFASQKNGSLQLQVSDNGVGFDTKANTANGSGLKNMESRCKLINAKLSVQSIYNKGTSIIVQLPTLAGTIG